MEIECIFVAGHWNYKDDGNWDFVIDHHRMCRVVHFKESTVLSELSSVVDRAFGEAENGTTISLSYLSPDLESLDIGKRTPPVILTTNSSLRTCIRHLQDKKLTNIYVTFVNDGQNSSYVTPIVGQKRKVPNSVGGCSLDEDVAVENEAVGSQEPLEVCLLNKAFLNAVEAIEDKMMSSGKTRASGESSTIRFDQANDSDSSGDSVEAEEVGSRGYDRDFWEPLLDDTFGGSNAVEIMLEHDFGLAGRNLSNEFCNTQTVQTSQSTHRPDSPHQSTRSVAGGSLSGIQSNVQSSKGKAVVNDSDTDHEVTPNGQHGPPSNNTPAEIDTPPLFDDTQYASTFIPDLDSDEGEDTIVIGRTFVSKTECQIALAIYAIRNMFQFKQRRTTKTNFVVTCADLTCCWLVNARKKKENSYYKITKANLEHTCCIETRSNFTKMATSKVIAHLYKSKYGVLDDGPKPKNIQKLVMEDLGVSTSYSKCWRANQAANDGVRGTEEESYSKVEEYLHILRLANPGSITDIKTATDEEGVERFLYLFLAFGASIEGFKHVHPVLVLDGTHLSGKYKGVLLTASGQDANFQVFPLAFAIVDAETDASWHWFLSKVEGIVGDSPSLAVISDRHRSIVKASKSVFKQARHGACIVHLSRNVVSNFKNKGLAKLVMKAASAYNPKTFKNVFQEIVSISVPCAKYLKEIGFETWARACFPVNRFNLLTSNIAESLNSALRNGRRSTITELLIFIQTMLMRWFSSRRERALTYKGQTTPEVDRIITSNLKLAKGTKITSVSSWSSEVVGKFGQREYVQLSHKRCSCKVYDTLKIPCGHALIVAGDKQLPYSSLVGDHYRSSVWAKTYEGLIQPNGDPADYEIPEAIKNRVIQPPRTRRPCGRPKANRIPSTGEIPEVKLQRKCGRCGVMGHNKTSCKNPI